MKPPLKTLLVLIALSLVGCASDRAPLITTQFLSNPPGAHIEIDGNYIGNTPITYTWPRSYQDGERFSQEVRVIAFPSGSNAKQFKQEKFYESHHRELPLIPSRVYFDMTLAPTTEPGSN